MSEPYIRGVLAELYFFSAKRLSGLAMPTKGVTGEWYKDNPSPLRQNFSTTPPATESLTSTKLPPTNSLYDNSLPQNPLFVEAQHANRFHIIFVLRYVQKLLISIWSAFRVNGVLWQGVVIEEVLLKKSFVLRDSVFHSTSDAIRLSTIETIKRTTHSGLLYSIYLNRPCKTSLLVVRQAFMIQHLQNTAVHVSARF